MHRIPAYLLVCLAINLSAQTVPTVKIAYAYDNQEIVNLSDLAESIEYIPLETSMKTLLRYPKVKGIQGDSIILVHSSMRISIFDRNTGKFLNDIGHRGDDPNGFNINGQLGFNTTNGNIFASRFMFRYIEYSPVTNQVVKVIPKPDYIEGDPIAVIDLQGRKRLRGISTYHWMHEGYIAGYVQNLGGTEKLKLVIYDRDGKVVKYHNNGRTFRKDPKQSIKGYIVNFHDYNEESFFKEWFSDTLYSFSSKKLTPKYYLNTGSHRPIYERQDLISDVQRRDLMFLNVTTQVVNNLYFKVYHKDKYKVGLFNKKTHKTQIAKQQKNELLGFHNDIDNFVPFSPSFTTHEGNLIGIITAEEMLDWFSNNPELANKLPQRLKQFRNIDPEDNPIVMIVKPKHQ